jgi:aspartate racemase
MESADLRSPAEPEAPPESRHVGLIGGLGVGAAITYYRSIAAGCADRGAVPRITMVHAHAPIVLAHVAAGRIEELADYLASFVAELRRVGSTLFAIPAVTPHIALAALGKRDSLPVVDMLEVTARGLRERGFSRVALFGTRFTIETALFGALDAFDVIAPRPREIDEIHRVYLELATAGHTSAAGVEVLRDIARAVRRRDRIDAVVLAGTDLNLIFDEASAGFPAFDCASAHINAILDQAAPGRPPAAQALCRDSHAC